MRHVIGLDGVHGLISLFHHVAGDALVGLLLVPGAPVRRAQRLDGGHELVEGGVLGRLHLGYQLLSHSIAPFDCGFPQHYSAPAFARSSDVFEQRLPSAFSQFLKKPEQRLPVPFRSFPRSSSSRIRALSSSNPHFGALKAHIFLQKRDISGKRGVQPAVFYYDRVAKNGETLVPKPSGTSVLRVKALLEGHRLEKEK